MTGRPNFMNTSYFQTFDRHRLLFSLPVMILSVLALWVVVSTPKEYKAGASLFIDNPVTQPSSFDDPNETDTPPAAQAQQLLTELLATKSFQMEVGRKGPLTKYLEAHSTEGWGPSGLLRKLRGSGSAEDRTAKALDANHVLTTLPGKQILGLEYHGPTPEVTVGTVNALVEALNDERINVDISRQQQAVTHFKLQADTARNAIAQMNARLNEGNLSPGEAQGITQARNSAETRLRRGIRGYNQAALNLAVAKEAGPLYQVRDEPSLPAPAVSGMKKSVFGVVAGIFVGLLISILAIVFLTSSEDKDSGDGEREELREVIARADDLDIDAPTGTNGSTVPRVPRVKATGER